MGTVLEVKNLQIELCDNGAGSSVVEGISFSIDEGETLGIVGESGCGKTVTALSIMGLLPGNMQAVSGNIYFKGSDLLGKTDKEIRGICGKEIGMVFQEPMTSLNPLLTVGEQIGESLKYHFGYNKQQRKEKTLELLEQVGISNPEKRINQYPHEFSGGMRQRVMIAMALVCNPGLIIADEPTTALDVTVQAQIIELIRGLKEKYRNSLLLITHNWGIVAELADKVLVMYAGEIVETGSVRDIFKRPQHPYTEALLEAVEQLNNGTARLKTVSGTVPKPGEKLEGCKFAARCKFAKQFCQKHRPKLYLHDDGRQVRCWKGTREYADSK